MTRYVLLFHLSVTDLPNCEILISAFPISNSWKKTVTNHIYFFMSGCQKGVDHGPEGKAQRQADSFRRAYGRQTAPAPDVSTAVFTIVVSCKPKLTWSLTIHKSHYTLKQRGNLLTYPASLRGIPRALRGNGDGDEARKVSPRYTQ